jgi:23S rRNA pseudouridine1911/1915/1917 synthase
MPKTLHTKHLKQPTRLDKFLRDSLPHIGRQAINQLIQDKQVRANGKAVWLNSWKVKRGDTVTLARVPSALPQQTTQFDVSWLIADDGDLIALNKPAGLLSQATKYGKQTDLLTMAQAHFGERLSLIHRLDRDTSGVILLARPSADRQALDSAFKQHRIQKRYVALVAMPNNLDQEGTITARIATHAKHRQKQIIVSKGGQFARTEYMLDATSETHQRVILYPETGRTHQLRVHLAHMDAPILGDRLYSQTAEKYPRLFLHAERITLPAMGNTKERTYQATLPDGF